MRKFLSVVLAFLMLAVMLPVTAMAAEVEVSTYEQMKTALATPGAYVKLTADIDATGFSYTENPLAPGDTITVADNSTLDLNGKTFTVNNFGVVFSGNNFTIRNGKMVCNNGGSYALFLMNANNVTLDSIETTGGINVFENAKGVILRNMMVNGTKYYSVWCEAGSSATIESGEYSSDSTIANSLLGLDASASLTIKGGSFYSRDKNIVLSDNNGLYGAPTITGGTFYATPEQIEKIKEYIPADSETTFENDGFTVKPKTPTQIVIIQPAEDKPAEDQKNPATGANDMVAAAVALMAVSALGMAVLTRKK